jgi:hypothetical protein
MAGVRLRRVNHDTSWLITFSTDSSYPKSTFNLVSTATTCSMLSPADHAIESQLVDPWLDESVQVDYHAAFSEQKRTEPALCSSVSSLEDMLASEEEMQGAKSEDSRGTSKQIDAILISHPFTDHMHPGTLNDSSVPTRIPFFVTNDSKAALESLLGGKKRLADEKRTISLLDQAKHETAPERPSEDKKRTLPCNINIMQILPRERFSLLSGAASIAWSKLHGGILFLWQTSQSDLGSTHSLIYSPHGLGSKSVPAWLQADSKIHHEAILTSLDKIILPSWLSGVVNLGLSSALDLVTQEVYNAKRILATHEERKEARGLVAHLIKRYWLALETPDAQNDGLTKLKQRDANRQVEAQRIVTETLDPLNKSAQVLVLDINQPLVL